MFCDRCGVAIPDDASFCPACGQVVQKAEGAADNTQPPAYNGGWQQPGPPDHPPYNYGAPQYGQPPVYPPQPNQYYGQQPVMQVQPQRKNTALIVVGVVAGVVVLAAVIFLLYRFVFNAPDDDGNEQKLARQTTTEERSTTTRTRATTTSATTEKPSETTTAASSSSESTTTTSSAAATSSDTGTDATSGGDPFLGDVVRYFHGEWLGEQLPDGTRNVFQFNSDTFQASWLFAYPDGDDSIEAYQAGEWFVEYISDGDFYVSEEGITFYWYDIMDPFFYEMQIIDDNHVILTEYYEGIPYSELFERVY